MTLPGSSIQAVSLNRYLFSHSGAVLKARANDGGSTEADFSLSSGSLVLTSDGTTSLGSWLSSLSASAAFCTTLYDHDGTNNVTQTTAASQPEIKEDGTGNQKNYLDFNSDWLDTADLLDLAGWSAFSVAEFSNLTGERQLFGTTFPNRLYYGIRSSGWMMRIGSNAYSTAGTLDTDAHVFSCLGDSAGSSNCEFRVDKTAEVTQSNTSTATPTSQNVGSFNSGGGTFFIGKLYEYVAYSSLLSDADRDSAEDDLDSYYLAAGGANPKGPLGMPLHGPFGGPIGA